VQKIIVQKFGGTSLNNITNQRKAIKHILECKRSGAQPVVIVSAPGRSGDPYATDTLLAVKEQLSSRHIPREQDMLLSCGETISACLMSILLQEAGFKAIALNGTQAGIITDENHTCARILYVEASKLQELIENDVIPVIAGFQGMSISGEVTTFGRGGSDTSAAVIAAALKADSLEIFSDVEGVMSADPDLVSNAVIIPEMDYKDIFELSLQGAKVIHPRAAALASQAGIPVKLKSTLTGKHKTTIYKIKSDKPITGITSKKNIAYVKIISGSNEEYENALKTFTYLSEKKISVDFIDIRPEAITFVVSLEQSDRVADILSLKNIKAEIDSGFTMISIVGAGMTGLPGIMSRIVETLQKAGICIYQTTDSHSSISVMIKREDESNALNSLHKAFDL